MNDQALAILSRANWRIIFSEKSFKCGICGKDPSTQVSIYKEKRSPGSQYIRDIRICNKCEVATTFDARDQFPQPKLGKFFDPKKKQPDVQLIIQLYDEAKNAISSNAQSCAVLMFRKLLMHMAVAEKAKKNQSFAYYCEYLKTNNIIASPQYVIVDRIKDDGNDENHEIRRASKDQASDLLRLTTHLIESLYFLT